MTGLWPYNAPDEKRLCPIGGKNCYAATFDSYRQMLEHCRQKHPERLPLGGEQAIGLVVTDTRGKVLSWEEVRQIIDDPSFWWDPQETARMEDQEEMGFIQFRPHGEVARVSS